MVDYKNIDKVSEKFVELDNVMKIFRDVYLKYYVEFIDEFDIDEFKEYYDFEEVKVFWFFDNIIVWINIEKCRIEEIIVDYVLDVGVLF